MTPDRERRLSPDDGRAELAGKVALVTGVVLPVDGGICAGDYGGDR